VFCSKCVDVHQCEPDVKRVKPSGSNRGITCKDVKEHDVALVGDALPHCQTNSLYEYYECIESEIMCWAGTESKMEFESARYIEGRCILRCRGGLCAASNSCGLEAPTVQRDIGGRLEAEDMASTK
jgi:hypothetical protein